MEIPNGMEWGQWWNGNRVGHDVMEWDSNSMEIDDGMEWGQWWNGMGTYFHISGVFLNVTDADALVPVHRNSRFGGHLIALVTITTELV